MDAVATRATRALRLLESVHGSRHGLSMTGSSWAARRRLSLTDYVRGEYFSLLRETNVLLATTPAVFLRRVSNSSLQTAPVALINRNMVTGNVRRYAFSYNVATSRTHRRLQLRSARLDRRRARPCRGAGSDVETNYSDSRQYGVTISGCGCRTTALFARPRTGS